MRLVDCLLKEKKLFKLPEERKVKTNNTVTVIKNGVGAVVDGTKVAGDLAIDVAYGTGLWGKCLMGKKDPMPRLCDDQRRGRAALAIGTLLIIGTLLSAYRGYKRHQENFHAPENTTASYEEQSKNLQSAGITVLPPIQRRPASPSYGE